MDKLVENAAAILLSDADIRLICQQDVAIVGFYDLKDYKNLNQVFDESDAVVIYYAVDSETRGHYSTLIWHPDEGVVEAWDSYGFPIEELGKRSDFDYRRSNGVNYLEHLIARAIEQYGVRFVQNRKRFQQFDEDVNTCGRYACLRAKFRDLSLEDFNALLTGQTMPADMIASYMTVLFSENMQELDQLAKKTLDQLDHVI